MSKLRQRKTVTQEPKPEHVEVVEDKVEEVVETKAASKRLGRGPSKEALARRKRYMRTPRSGRRFILAAQSDDPSMRLRWVENTPDRVDEVMNKGYEPVRGQHLAKSGHFETGENVGSLVTKRVGQGKEFVLMQIPQEWYEADRLEYAKEIDTKEAAMRRDLKNLEGGYGKGLRTKTITGREPDRTGQEEAEQED